MDNKGNEKGHYHIMGQMDYNSNIRKGRMKLVRDYAKKHNVTEAKAICHFIENGYPENLRVGKERGN